MNYDKIGSYIKNLRIKNHMSQNDLARQLGIGRENISKWENGVSLPDIENLIIISKIFKVSVDNLLNGEGDENTNKDIYYELCKDKNNKNLYLKRNIKLLTSLVLVLSLSSIIFISYLFYNAYKQSIENNPNVVVNEDSTYSNNLLNNPKS